jgi:hypothetical protein
MKDQEDEWSVLLVERLKAASRLFEEFDAGEVGTHSFPEDEQHGESAQG